MTPNPAFSKLKAAGQEMDQAIHGISTAVTASVALIERSGLPKPEAEPVIQALRAQGAKLHAAHDEMAALIKSLAAENAQHPPQSETAVSA